MRLIIRWRCGDTDRWGEQLGQTTALCSGVFMPFKCHIGKFYSYIKTRLATRSASGFGAVFEVRSVNDVWSTRSGFLFCFYFIFLFFLNCPLPDGSGKKGGFHRGLRRLGEVDVTGRCLLTRFIKSDWNTFFWSRPTPETCPSHARPRIVGGRRWEIHRRGGEQKYWGLFVCKKEGRGDRSVFDPSQDAQTMALLCFPPGI